MCVEHGRQRARERKRDISNKNKLRTHTVCQRNSDPFYIGSYYIKWVTTQSVDCRKFMYSSVW